MYSSKNLIFSAILAIIGLWGAGVASQSTVQIPLDSDIKTSENFFDKCLRGNKPVVVKKAIAFDEKLRDFLGKSKADNVKHFYVSGNVESTSGDPTGPVNLAAFLGDSDRSKNGDRIHFPVPRFFWRFIDLPLFGCESLKGKFHSMNLSMASSFWHHRFQLNQFPTVLCHLLEGNTRIKAIQAQDTQDMEVIGQDIDGAVNLQSWERQSSDILSDSDAIFDANLEQGQCLYIPPDWIWGGFSPIGSQHVSLSLAIGEGQKLPEKCGKSPRNMWANAITLKLEPKNHVFDYGSYSQFHHVVREFVESNKEYDIKKFAPIVKKLLTSKTAAAKNMKFTESDTKKIQKMFKLLDTNRDGVASVSDLMSLHTDPMVLVAKGFEMLFEEMHSKIKKTDVGPPLDNPILEMIVQFLTPEFMDNVIYPLLRTINFAPEPNIWKMYRDMITNKKSIRALLSYIPALLGPVWQEMTSPQGLSKMVETVMGFIMPQGGQGASGGPLNVVMQVLKAFTQPQQQQQQPPSEKVVKEVPKEKVPSETKAGSGDPTGDAMGKVLQNIMKDPTLMANLLGGNDAINNIAKEFLTKQLSDVLGSIKKDDEPKPKAKKEEL